MRHKVDLPRGISKRKHRLHYMWRTWSKMIERCRARKGTKNGRFYEYYASRGIRVCMRWDSRYTRKAFQNFLGDMGMRPKGLTLERINNDRGYMPSNCRWATKLEQGANKRNNRRITINGTSRTASEWARASGLSVAVIYERLKRGTPHTREAMLRPSRDRRRSWR